MSERHQSAVSNRMLDTIASARRAAAVERFGTMDVNVEVRPLTSLGGMVEAWSTLAVRAIEPNVFLEPAFAQAAAPALGSDVQVGLVWSRSSPPELLGLFPVRIEGRRYGLPLAVLRAWTHPYAPLGAPLVHRDATEPAIAGWLDHIASDPSLPALLLMPYVRDDGPFAAVLDTVLARRGCAAASYDRHQRALLAPGEDRAGYLDQSVAPKRRKELGRKWRRMQDQGAVAIARAEDPASVARALDDFFQLEAGGWKGRAGTAAATDPAIRQFMTRAVSDLAANKQATIHRLTINDKPIAVCIALHSGHSAWGWKIAYDEAFARFSPGAHLMIEVTTHLLNDSIITQADSLATPGHPLIDHVWRERCFVSDRLIAVKSDTFLPFAVACRLEAMRRLGRSAARTILAQLRGR